MPLKASPKSYTTLVQFKVDKMTFDWLDTISKENNVTMAAYLRAIITDARMEPKTGVHDSALGMIG